jgi:hypothetical protein
MKRIDPVESRISNLHNDVASSSDSLKHQWYCEIPLVLKIISFRHVSVIAGLVYLAPVVHDWRAQSMSERQLSNRNILAALSCSGWANMETFQRYDPSVSVAVVLEGLKVITL